MSIVFLLVKQVHDLILKCEMEGGMKSKWKRRMKVRLNIGFSSIKAKAILKKEQEITLNEKKSW